MGETMRRIVLVVAATGELCLLGLLSLLAVHALLVVSGPQPGGAPGGPSLVHLAVGLLLLTACVVVSSVFTSVLPPGLPGSWLRRFQLLGLYGTAVLNAAAAGWLGTMLLGEPVAGGVVVVAGFLVVLAVVVLALVEAAQQHRALGSSRV